MKLILFFKRFFCHHKIKHVRNIHGDEIIHANCRSYFRCTKCGKIFNSDYLHHLDKVYDKHKED